MYLVETDHNSAGLFFILRVSLTQNFDKIENLWTANFCFLIWYVNLCFKLLEEHLISRSIGCDAELYKCAADLVGPSQLFTVTTKIVSYW